MATLPGSPCGRRSSGLLLLLQLLVVGVLPLAEALHDHGPAAGPEIHAGTGGCEHRGHPAECSLLRIVTAPALPAHGAGSLLPGMLVLTSPLPTPSVDPGDDPLSSGLPRAPPLH